MISGAALLSVLVLLVIGGLICWLLWWFIGYVGIPEPFNKVARVIVALVAVVFLINLLLTLGGHPLVRW
jgi:hypothetical protein